MLKNVEDQQDRNEIEMTQNAQKVKDLPRDPSKISAWSVPPSEAVFPSL